MSTELGKISKILLIILALFGLIISVELCVVYFNANFNPGAGASFCSVNEVIDCDAVSKTPYSRFLGVPLSLWGAGFYVFILGLLLFFRRAKSYVFVLAGFSVIVSLTMAFISSFVIQKICILCHALYLINFLLFLACLMGDSVKNLFQNAVTDIKNLFLSQKWFITIAISGFTALITLIFINIYQPFVPEHEAVNANTSDEHPYTIGEIGNTLGAEHPRLVIREFTDYECPFCATSNKMMLKLTGEISDIRVEHHDYPLNSECNPLINVTVHKNGCTAAYYARAARKQGKFWDLSTLMFENQHDLSEKNILKLAKTIGLDIEQLKKDAHDPQLRDRIGVDVLKAKGMGIYGTPSYVIGIKKIEGAMPYHKLKSKVMENLR